MANSKSKNSCSSNNNSSKISYISVPSQIIHSLSSSSLQSLLVSPKKSSKQQHHHQHKFSVSRTNPKFWFFFLFLFSFLGMLRVWYNLDPLVQFLPTPCSFTTHFQSRQLVSFDARDSVMVSDDHVDYDDGDRSLVDDGGEEFFEQPNGLGYKPCLGFTKEFREMSNEIVKDRKRYLLVVVSGGMNQQRNQIVDAVVIARILGAALVVPILQVNVIWGDESEFSDIFDLEHFKKVLGDDVRVVSSLPSTHVMTRPVEEKQTPLHVSPAWIRARYHKRIKREGVLLLRGLDSRLSKDLSPDLQKLRCKVAFHALRFAPPVLELGNRLAKRMRSKGPYIALHLRMEKDVWVRTGCLPGLSQEYDEIVSNERTLRPKLLTGRSNMTYHDRKLAGLCPLNAVEVKRLLRALGAPRNAMIYWAGGPPLGGREALLPLTTEFTHFYNKEDLALPGELEPFQKKASLLAALDYIVSEDSDVFMPSHGGNMGRAIQGHRAYAGHRKYITPNKRQMLPYFLNASLSEPEFRRVIRELHRGSLGQPELRTSKIGRDPTQYPVYECMCNNKSKVESS